MKSKVSERSLLLSLLGGILGCLLMGGSDWLMIYGDTAFEGQLAWLTVGVAQIPAWRTSLAMALAIPAVLLYGVGLFAVRHFIRTDRGRVAYCALTAAGMTPWLCLHLFYVMILFLFGWMHRNGEAELAFSACEALFGQFSWLVLAADVLMVLPFLYLLWLIAAKKTIFPRWMALNSPLVYFVLLKVLVNFLPDAPFRLAFLNGLMSEAMLIWFLVLLFAFPRFSRYQAR